MGIERGKLSRRDLILGAGAAAAAAGAAGLAYLADKELPGSRKGDKLSRDTLKPSERGAMRERHEESFLNVEKHPASYRMGRLAGVKVSDLLSKYTIGEDRRLNAEESIDFRFQQAQLWKDKLEYVRNSRFPEYYASVRNAAQKMFGSYRSTSLTKMTLGEYGKSAEAALKDVRRDFVHADITKLPAFKTLQPVQVELLKRLEEGITGGGLIAYALTEIMPTKGESSGIGADVLDFLLQNAGVEFVDRIPAIHDHRVSIGPYQFTSDALLELGHARNGASVIQHILKQRHIPGSVLQLEGDTNHKAAHLFAVYNLAMLVRKLGPVRSEKILAHFSELPEDIVTEYIAAAHHLPANALHAFDAYADELIKFGKKSETEKKKETAPPSFLRHCETKGVGDYCKKTQGNIAALRARP